MPTDSWAHRLRSRALGRRDRSGQGRRVYLLLDHVYGHGGVPRTSLGLAKSLADRGYQVEIITVLRRRGRSFFPIDRRVTVSVVEDHRTPQGNLTAKDNPDRSLVARLLDRRPSSLVSGGQGDSANMSLLTDLKLRRKLRSLEPGIVIATRPPLAVAVARWAPAHVIKTTQEHISFRGRSPRARTALRESAHDLDALLTLTERDKQAWLRALGDDSTTLVEAIPNASPFAPGDPSPLDSKIVMAAGRLSMQKGFDRLIPAFAPLAREHPDWQLHIYGVGPTGQDLQQMISAEHLDDHVVLKGMTNQIEEVFANAAIYAMSSRFEGLPMVLLEAMSKGVPLVSFDCPQGPRQLIEHDQNGLLVPNHDIPALTAALRELIEDDDKRARLGAGAYKTSQEYEAAAVLDRWEALFDELVRRRRGRADARRR